jgi:anti-sigma factor RsiW
MTCRELSDFLADYFEGEIPGPRRAAFEDHLARCPACVRYVEQYREVVRLGRTCAASHEAPGDVPEELVQAILAARG